MRERIFSGKALLLLVLVLSIALVGAFALVGCSNDEATEEDTTEDQGTPALAEDGTYKISGMREGIFMHPENFSDDLIVEKKDNIYYVTIGILNNEKVERLFWNGRKDSMTTDAKITKDGNKTDYMFAFTNKQVQKKLDFKIGGGKMPLEPSFAFTIDFSKAVKISDTIAEGERPEPFLGK